MAKPCETDGEAGNDGDDWKDPQDVPPDKRGLGNGLEVENHHHVKTQVHRHGGQGCLHGGARMFPQPRGTLSQVVHEKPEW